MKKMMMLRRLSAVAGGLLLCSTAMAQGQGAGAHFDIRRFEVDGNTLLQSSRVDAVLADYAGSDRDFSTLEQARQALEEAFGRAGFKLVRVVLPEQKIEQGVVHLKVIEATVGSIAVKGNKHFDDANIRASVPALQEGASPDFNAVSASLRVANENPAKKVTLALQSGQQAGQANRVDATLDTKDDKPWIAAVSVDNTGDRVTGRNRASFQYQHANIAGLDHVLSLQYVTSLSHPNDVNIFGAGYHIPLYALGDSVDLFASYANVNSGTVSVGQFDLNVMGSGTVAGVRYNHYLKQTGAYGAKLVAGLDYKAMRNNVSLAGIPLGNDVTVHPFSLTYAGEWRPASTVLSFYLSGIQNIPGGQNGGNAELQAARSGASASYNMLRFGASYELGLPRDWQLRLRLNGQYTAGALVPTEQFGIGGVSTVRGFEEHEIAGDKGRATSAELYTPNMCGGGKQCRALVFYDTGYISDNKTLAGEKKQQSIGSIGIGGRLSVAPNITLQADFAHVVDGSDQTPKGNNRVLFSLMMQL